jgi:hypothetical protein
VLRDAAAEVNPEFRVILNMGPFTAERPAVWRGLGDGVDPEDALASGSTEDQDDLQARGAIAHFSAPVAPGFGPVLGVACPWIIHENLKHLVSEGVDVLAQAGQVVPPSMAPWCINHEVWRGVHLSRIDDVGQVVTQAAERWVGSDLADQLIEGWRGADAAVRAYSPRLYLYGSFGFVLYRLWVRPLVPDIEAIPETDRAYYEEFMLSTWNNPTRVDLSRDVMFLLNTPDEALAIVRQMDAHCWAPLDDAIRSLTETVAALSASHPARPVFVDQRDRLRALRCYLRTQRNVAAWIAGVPGYLQAADEDTRTERRHLLQDMIDDEIKNTEDLVKLWETSPVTFMATSIQGENPYFYADNLGDLLRRRMELMRAHQADEPYIDPDFMWRVPGLREAPPRRPQGRRRARGEGE